MRHSPIRPDEAVAAHRRDLRLPQRLPRKNHDHPLPRRQQRASHHRGDQRQRACENQSRYNRHDHLLTSAGPRLTTSIGRRKFLVRSVFAVCSIDVPIVNA